MVVQRCKEHLRHSAVAASLFPSRKTRCSRCGRSPCGKTERTFLCKIISFLLNLHASDQIIFRDQVLGLSSTFQQQVCSSKSLFSDTSTQDCRIVCSNFVGCVQQKFIFSSLNSSSPPPKNHLLLLSPETLLLLFLLPPETLRFLLSPLRLFLLSSLGM